MSVADARTAVEPYLFGRSRIERAERDSEEWEDRDSFDLDGTVAVERVTAAALSDDSRDEVAGQYLAAGFTQLPRDSLREDEHARFRLDRLDASIPFLREQEVQVGVAGRELIGAQRKVLAAKVESLRAELEGAAAGSKRRARVESMLRDLEEGLLTRISVEVRRRVFRAAPVLEEGAEMGDRVPLGRMSQLVYTVVPKDPADREDDAAPMYITLLGLDDRQVSFLFSGGIAGRRTIRDLEVGPAHNAWFQNRKRVETEDTAPWVSRSVLRRLEEDGEAELIVKRGREEEPIALERVGEETLSLPVGGEPRDLEVLVAESEKEDRFWILRDPGSPLVLRLEEAGADLVRTVDEIRRLEGY